MGSVTKATAPPLTKSEGRGLQYAIGYVCKHVHKKIVEHYHELLCLVSLLNGSDSEDCGTDEDWIKAQVRGGLTCERDNIFSFPIN